jgi:hypothetical protein
LGLKVHYDQDNLEIRHDNLTTGTATGARIVLRESESQQSHALGAASTSETTGYKYDVPRGRSLSCQSVALILTSIAEVHEQELNQRIASNAQDDNLGLNVPDLLSTERESNRWDGEDRESFSERPVKAHTNHVSEADLGQDARGIAESEMHGGPCL